MSDETDKSHLIIPAERISKDIVNRTGFGEQYPRADLATHGRSLKQNFSAINEKIQLTHDSGLMDTVIVSIKTPSDWEAKKEKMHLHNLGAKILDYSSSKDQATIGINKGKWVELGRKINEYADENGKGKTNLQGIDSFVLRSPEDSLKIENSISDDETINVIISLFSILRNSETLAISKKISEDLLLLGEKVKHHVLSDGDIIIEGEVSKRNLIGIASNYSTIRSIVKNSTIRIKKTSLSNSVTTAVLMNTPVTNQIIAVFDDGISTRSDLRNLVKIRIPPKGFTPTNEHGTFVASRCLLGDINGETLSSSLVPCCYLADIPLFGIDSDGNEVGPTDAILITELDDFVSKYHTTVRVYNLSLGGVDPIEDAISDVAKRIDILSNRYSILFVISSGNIEHANGIFPDEHYIAKNSRICSPAESILAITVGSIAKIDVPNGLSKANELSPFSKIGPGLYGTVKPELVAHGGNITTDWSTQPGLATLGFSVGPQTIATENGTSFSAPVISNYAARLFDYYPDFSSNMIKALLIHFAIPRNFPSPSLLQPNHGCGFGEPSIKDCFQAKKSACTFLHEGELDQENYSFVPFHVPQSMIGSRNRLRIRVTVIFNPELNVDNDDEYCSCKISCSLLHRYNGTIKSKAASDNIVREGYTPIIHFETTFVRNFDPGEWYVKLRLFTRNIDSADYRQKYAIIIDVVDEINNANVRDLVIAENPGVYKRSKATRKAA